jgi:hypothetical protein
VRDQGEKEEENGETRCKILSLEEKKEEEVNIKLLHTNLLYPS